MSQLSFTHRIGAAVLALICAVLLTIGTFKALAVVVAWIQASEQPAKVVPCVGDHGWYTCVGAEANHVHYRVSGSDAETLRSYGWQVADQPAADPERITDCVLFPVAGQPGEFAGKCVTPGILPNRGEVVVVLHSEDDTLSCERFYVDGIRQADTCPGVFPQ